MKRTVQGRVVYDRKPHDFKAKDVIRILETFELADYSSEFGGFRDLLEIYFQTWRLTIEGLSLLLVKDPERAGDIILKIIGEFVKAISRLLVGAPGRVKFAFLEVVNYLLLKGKE